MALKNDDDGLLGWAALTTFFFALFTAAGTGLFLVNAKSGDDQKAFYAFGTMVLLIGSGCGIGAATLFIKHFRLTSAKVWRGALASLPGVAMVLLSLLFIVTQFWSKGPRPHDYRIISGPRAGTTFSSEEQAGLILGTLILGGSFFAGSFAFKAIYRSLNTPLEPGPSPISEPPLLK